MSSKNATSIIFTIVIALVALIATVQVSAAEAEFGGVRLERLKRAAASEGTTNGKEDVSGINLAEETSEDYPIIFNILLWLGVGLFIATLAICTAIATMDPGRDSLIYRVTSAQRFKKDQ